MHISIAVWLLSAALFVSPAFGQAGVIVKKGAKAARTKAAVQRARKQQVDRLSAMSPQDRDRALAQLPPARRREMERRLEQYRNMTPEERKRIVDQAAALTPAQRRAMRDGVERMNRLPEERRPLVRQEVARLRRMTPEERKERLASAQVKEKFKGDEQKLLADLSESLPPPPSQ